MTDLEIIKEQLNKMNLKNVDIRYYDDYILMRIHISGIYYHEVYFNLDGSFKVKGENDEFQRLKVKETPMLVDLNMYIYGGVTIKETNYFCPNCYNKIKRNYNYCPTCGQRLLWADIYDTKTTTEDNENVKKGE